VRQKGGERKGVRRGNSFPDGSRLKAQGSWSFFPFFNFLHTFNFFPFFNSENKVVYDKVRP